MRKKFGKNLAERTKIPLTRLTSNIVGTILKRRALRKKLIPLVEKCKKKILSVHKDERIRYN